MANIPVAPNGERAIASLHLGNTVLAYDPTTGKAEPELVQHVWINHDSDLVDVGLQSSTGSETATPPASPSASSTASRGKQRVAASLALAAALAISGHAAHPAQATHTATSQSATTETIHTTANHPWLTADRGWVEAGELRTGEPVVTLAGGTSTVAWVHVVPGQADYYNLTVAKDHTYAVGDAQAAVHNRCTGSGIVQFDLKAAEFTAEERAAVDDFIVRSNQALQDQLDRTGQGFVRRSVDPALRHATDLVKDDWAEMNAASRPGPDWVAGHIPDTVWTGQVTPPGGFMWLPSRPNSIIGSQSLRYANDFVVQGFSILWK